MHRLPPAKGSAGLSASETNAGRLHRTCHLTGPNQVEVLFSHSRVKEMLRQSVHGPDHLAKANQLLGSPLNAGQSQCLLCHEEPSFTRGGQTWLQVQAPIGRCNTCHQGQLAIDTQQFYSHVTSRARPARTNEDLTRVCAVCHSNPYGLRHVQSSGRDRQLFGEFSRQGDAAGKPGGR